MIKSDILNYLKKNTRLKHTILWLVVHPVKCRPRFWVRILQCFYIKRGKQSVIYNSVRRDIVPFRKFYLGDYSIIEDFCCINNAVGDIHIGNHTRIGLHNTLIGPVTIGNHVHLAQGVVVSGLNHNFNDTARKIDEQGVTTKPIHIDNDVWIGANSVIAAGIKIGTHCVIGAGSVVTHDVPPFSVVCGCPAKVVKKLVSS